MSAKTSAEVIIGGKVYTFAVMRVRIIFRKWLLILTIR